jgi:hypothetical protein
VSKDGKSVKISLPEAEDVEKIRVVEVPGSSAERIVECIKVVEVEKHTAALSFKSVYYLDVSKYGLWRNDWRR